MNRSLIQDTEWKMMEAETNGEFERANQILGELESTHSGLLFARTYCEVCFRKKNLKRKKEKEKKNHM